MRLPSPPLLVITDRRQTSRPLGEVVRAAMEAGCRWVSLREKDMSDAEQIVLLEALAPLVRAANGRLTLHGKPALARAGVVDGVHLPASADLAAARALLGPEKTIGVSIHTAVEAAALDPQVVDYAIAGPVFATESKPGYGPALGPAGIAEVVRKANVPVLGIGGIEATNAGDVISAGAAGIAVMGSIMRSNEPKRTVSALVEALDSIAQPRPR